MKVKAKRSDSWLGISKGKIYEAKSIKNRIMVYTDGYIVAFNDKDFMIIDKN